MNNPLEDSGNESVTGERSAKYDGFISHSPIPLVEMDFSKAKQYIDSLKLHSYDGLEQQMRNDAEIVKILRSKIRLVDLNKSAQIIFGINSKEDARDLFPNLFPIPHKPKIMQMILQLMNGELKGEYEYKFESESIDNLDVHIYWYTSADLEIELSEVFISIIDITKSKAFENELIQQTNLQKVINSIYNLGIQNLPIKEIFDKVVRLVAQFMDAEYCKILRYQSKQDNLLLISGYGWKDGIEGNATVMANENSQAGFTLNSNSTVVVNDLLKETRFTGPDLLLDHNVRSGMSAIIKSDDNLFGILGVHSTKIQNFSIYSIDFFNSIALFLSNLVSRHNVQNELTASKLLYEDLYQTAPFMYFNIEFDTGKILNFNTEVVKTLGYSEEELQDKIITEIYHPRSFEQLDDEIIKLIKKGRVNNLEFRVIKRDGSEMDVLINTIGIRDDTGKLVITRSIWLDITERNAAKLKIIEQSEDIQNINRILNLKNHISDIVLYTHNENELNQKVCDILSEDETIKFTWIGYLRPDKYRTIEPIAFSKDYVSYQHLFGYKTLTDDSTTNPISQAVIYKKTVILNRKYMPASSPQELKWILQGDTKSIIILPLVVDDLCIGILIISSLIDYAVDDSSEINLFKEIASTLAFTIKAIRVESSQLMILQQLEDQKIQSLQLLTAIEQSPNIVMITKPDGNIEYINPKFTEITGYQLSEVKNKNPRILKSDLQEDKYYENLWTTISSGKDWHGEFMNKKKDGGFFWAFASIAPVIDESGEIINYIGIQRDITELKRDEARLNELQKMEAIGRLAAGISHDFKNILTAISLNVDYIDANLNEIDPLREETMEIRKGVNMATATIQQLLAFSGSSEVEDFIEININTLIDKLLTWVQRLVGPDIDIKKINYCDNPIVMGNQTSAEQMLINLIINSKDAMPSGGVISISIIDLKNMDGYLYSDKEVVNCTSISNDLILEMDADRPYCLLTIIDTGMGIPQNVIQYIFEPYFTTKGVGKGTGLGLSTVYSIIKSFGGSIYVTSEVDVGTSFMILLPKLIQDQ